MNVEAVVVELVRMKLSPGEVLFIKVPKEWTPDQTRNMRDYLLSRPELEGLKNTIVVVPQGVDFVAVTQPLVNGSEAGPDPA